VVAINRPSEPTAETTSKALERASEGGRWADAKFNPATGEWIVPSASDPDKLWIVTVRNVNVPPGSWWQRLRCNCPAGKDGLAVCWHKAAVFIRREQQRRELRYYETATGLGPRLDDYRSYHSNDAGQGVMQPWPRRVAPNAEGMGGAGSGTDGGPLDGDENA